MTDELLDRTIDVNLKGTFIVSQEVARKMRGSGARSFIFLQLAPTPHKKGQVSIAQLNRLCWV